MSASPSLPKHWVQRESKSHAGKVYYFNTSTGATAWERPKPESKKRSEGKDGEGSAKKPRKEDTVRVLHILCKHEGSRRPSSWRSEVITLTKDAARDEIERIRSQLISTADLQDNFRALATERSDCSSAKRGGDLGEFGRGKMQKPFEEAAFALAVNTLSDVVETDSGLHLLYRLR
jgi:NIMA-interacting peptidyl-prolyl cis-trans isomerase 1